MNDQFADCLTAWEVAGIFDVKEATIRVWIHRGKLSVAGYQYADHPEFTNLQPRAMYFKHEVVALAASKGITVIDDDDGGVRAMFQAERLLNMSWNELIKLAEIGELRLAGVTSYGDPVVDLASVTEYAERNNIKPAESE
ncbi:hypothetical protein [Propionimicrobium sp. PCR01-08-3]|uniref:hypothetical protein n=1 Tax=Propionimicrobium sp. PCR01-08-3 TaxID=3052086 RepID=UPI00255CBA9F|nr:hypothetical protein [Propionimicrobium sp. PCR01-08-3]WIY81393.1 hypothetical protein QQ658_07485 [Propionimicrobium sp. PCR01-08-3]